MQSKKKMLKNKCFNTGEPLETTTSFAFKKDWKDGPSVLRKFSLQPNAEHVLLR